MATSFDEWNAFIEHGSLPEEIWASIASSWQRCREVGVNPNRLDIDCLGKSDLEGLLCKRERLLHLDRGVVDQLGSALHHAGVLVALFDPDALLLKLGGDEHVLRVARDYGMVVGADLSEESVGTNAVSLAIGNQHAIMCVAHEHYCRQMHIFAAAAAPLHNGDHDVLGVLATFAMAETVNPRHLLTLTRTSAELVEKRAHIKELSDETGRLGALLASLATAQSSPAIILGPRGYVRQISPAAMKLLGIRQIKDLEQPIDKIIAAEPPLAEIACTAEFVDDQPIKIRTVDESFVDHIASHPLFDGEQKHLGNIVVFWGKQDVRADPATPSERSAAAKFTFSDILGRAPSLVRAKETALKAAATSVNVLLEGESGTGKEMFAAAIHNSSDRRRRPFVTVNCAAIPKELIESELFGYRDGAFTGAKRGGQIGKFEAADGGTVFLDEIGDMPIELQSEMLRVIENKAIVRVGEYEEVPVNIRIIAATNKKLADEVLGGNFREDLYYRLSVTKIAVPRLSDCVEDIPEIVHAFIEDFNEKMLRHVRGIAPDVLERMVHYQWPGNFRELRNAVEHAVMVDQGEIIGWGHLPDDLRDALLYGDVADSKVDPSDPLRDAKESVERSARELYIQALRLAGGNVTQAARIVGVGRATFYRKMQLFDISRSTEVVT